MIVSNRADKNININFRKYYANKNCTGKNPGIEETGILTSKITFPPIGKKILKIVT